MNKLYRSRRHRVIGGVCGGLAQYFAADVSVIRLAWVLFSLLGGAGIVLYLLAWIIIPERQAHSRQGVHEEPAYEVDHAERTRLVGIILVAVGAYLLLERVISIRVTLWPLLLVLGGVALLMSGRQDPSPPPDQRDDGPPRAQGAERAEPKEKTSYEE